jgi:hypothetical protein
MAEELQLKIQLTSGGEGALPSVRILGSSTVGELKQAIARECGVECRRIIYRGKVLNQDNQLLIDAKIESGTTLHVQPAGPNPPASTSTAASHGSAPAAPAGASAGDGRDPMAVLSQALAAQLAGGSTSGAGSGQVSLNAILSQPPDVASGALLTLIKVVDNILKAPHEGKYRSIKKANRGFATKVGGVPGGNGCMEALGFVMQGDSWVLIPNEQNWRTLNMGRDKIARALSRYGAVPPPPVPIPAPAAPSPDPTVGPTTTSSTSSSSSASVDPDQMQQGDIDL